MNRSAEYHRLFQGRGRVHVRSRLATKKTGAITATIDCELEAGGEVGKHQQQADDELIICVSGEGWAEVGGARHVLSPQTPAVWVPFGTVVSFGAGPDAPLRYLIVKSRPL